MPEQEDVIGYADAAFLYRHNGWTPLPVRRSTKDQGLPSGYTGNMGIDPSGADIQSWCEERPTDNLVLRMTDNIIGIDVDAYDGKKGAETLAEAEKRWGKLPETVKTTSRDTTADPFSGIRFYRIPAGVMFEDRISFPDKGLGGIEIIQRTHRYALSWPSLHPEGRIYNWFSTKNSPVGIPNVEEIPELPAKWVEALRKKQVAKTLDFGSVEINACLTDGTPTPRVTARLAEAIKDLNTGHDSRHDVTCKHVLTLLRYGKDGDGGVMGALVALRELYIASVAAGPNSRKGETKEGAKADFMRMVTNQRAAQLLAAPSHDEWMKHLVTEIAAEMRPAATADPVDTLIDAAQKALEHGDGELAGRLFDAAQKLESEMKAKSAPAPAPAPAPVVDTSNGPDNAEPPPSEPDFYTQEEADFWQSRQSLAAIYEASMQRMCSPWAVLAHCTAIAITTVRPNATLPPIVGGKGSLNVFNIVVAQSGGGKSAAEDVAKEMIDVPIKQGSLGSGEGLIEAYIRPADRDTGEPSGYHEAVMFVADESENVRALTSRSGSTLLPKLREAWTSKTLAFGYRGRNNERLDAHTYRMTLVMAMQPTTADWILNDGGAGTPQRFMWFSGKDRRITEDQANDNALWPITLPNPTMWAFPQIIPVPDEARDLIRSERAKAMRGEQAALDGHALFCRLKFAFALAVLDGRTNMTLEDWELAGVAQRVSDTVRSWVVSRMAAQQRSEAQEKGVLRGVENYAADVEKGQQQFKMTERATRWLIKKLEAAGDEGLTRTQLTASADSGAFRNTLLEVAMKLAGEGLIRCERVGRAERWWLR